jgi:hypothetical protein
MTKWLLILGGILAGMVLGGWFLFQNPRPAICQFFQAPLMYFFAYLDQHTRPPGLRALAIVIPLWFLYWAFLGALVGFLLWLSFCLSRKWKHREENQHK